MLLQGFEISKLVSKINLLKGVWEGIQFMEIGKFGTFQELPGITLKEVTLVLGVRPVLCPLVLMWRVDYWPVFNH